VIVKLFVLAKTHIQNVLAMCLFTRGNKESKNFLASRPDQAAVAVDPAVEFAGSAFGLIRPT